MIAHFYGPLPAKTIWILACLFAAAISDTLAQTMTLVNSPNTNWNQIVCSADGNTLTCAPFPPPFAENWAAPGLIYFSTNAGTSWTTCNVGNPAVGNWAWSSLALSADGTTLVADSNNLAVYVSTNSGASWYQALTPRYGGETLGPVVASADGTKLVTSGLTLVLTSTNSGRTWITNESPSLYGFTSMKGSADAQMLVANYEFNFYLSTNFGVSWTNLSQVGLTETRSVGCASADGRVWVIQGDGGLVISTNYGASWSLNYDNGDPGHTLQVVCSASGTELTASQGESGDEGGIYFSTNTGATWQPFASAGSPAYLLASSADGDQIAATSTNGVYLIQSLPSPQLTLTPSPTSLLLSWTVPSINFILQQSSDLNSWSDITNPPTLDPDTLRYQINLPPTNNLGFYRLASP